MARTISDGPLAWYESQRRFKSDGQPCKSSSPWFVRNATPLASTTRGAEDTRAPAQASNSEGEARYLADRFEWAAPGDQQEDAWIVRFCDNDLRDMLFTGPDAERGAWSAWEKHAPGYNMYVFRLAALRAPAAAQDGEIAK